MQPEYHVTESNVLAWCGCTDVCYRPVTSLTVDKPENWAVCLTIPTTKLTFSQRFKCIIC